MGGSQEQILARGNSKCKSFETRLERGWGSGGKSKEGGAARVKGARGRGGRGRERRSWWGATFPSNLRGQDRKEASSYLPISRIWKQCQESLRVTDPGSGETETRNGSLNV